jgi:hypothetical protein
MSTILLEVPESQVVDWIMNLSPAARKDVLRALIPRLDEFEQLVDRGAERMRELCAERGLNWDDLDEQARQRLVDELMHENAS